MADNQEKSVPDITQIQMLAAILWKTSAHRISLLISHDSTKTYLTPDISCLYFVL